MKGLWLVTAAVSLLCPATAMDCGGIFSEAKGTITSPKYPEEQPHNRVCEYIIKAGKESRIKLSCPEINIKNRNCLEESLDINGIYTLCGNTHLDEVYMQGPITIRFTSDGKINSKRFFKCIYERISSRLYDEIQARAERNICPTQSFCPLGDAEYNYDEVLRKSLLFYEAQRSGFLPSSQRVTWRGHSATDDALDAETNGRIDLEGGYYDAGDYVKFGYPMAASAAVLAWGAVEYGEAYQAAGEMENMRTAVKWATDYFLKAHVEPNVFYGQVGLGDVDHAYWGRPEEMTMERPAFKITESKPGSDLAGETAAALAAASILFKDCDPTYSDTCLLNARQLYDFAVNFRGKYAESITDAAKFYNSWGVDDDELAWAALWLYRATGEATYLTQAKDHYSKLWLGVEEFSWAEKTPAVMVLMTQLVDASEKATYAQHLEDFCDRIINEKPRTPKGLLFLAQWGVLRYAANSAFVCLRAADLGIKSEAYREFGKQQIHYMLGSTGRSFVVGFGNNPPQRPHHASSSCKDLPEPCTWNDFNSPDPNPQILYGALVGGPDINDDYTDARNDYISNEVACDYNAAFQSAVAALRQLTGCGSDATVSPEITTDCAGSEATTATPEVTTGSGGSTSCATIQQTNEWPGNFQANLIVQIPFDTQSWSITLTFSGEISQFQVWVADPSATPSNTITLTNKSYNGFQTAGNTLIIDFIATFSGEKPYVTSITFNGTPLCLN